VENQFEKLDAWKKAHQLVLLVYRITYNFPKEERFSLTDQLRRAAVSIAANIAEGNIRFSKKEFAQYIYIAKGSLEESKYYFILAYDLKYISFAEYKKLQNLSIECGKLITGFLRYLKLNTKV
jgi:four helix bundle protein